MNPLGVMNLASAELLIIAMILLAVALPILAVVRAAQDQRLSWVVVLALSLPFPPLSLVLSATYLFIVRSEAKLVAGS
ncbi:MAG: hypothetical protein GY698_01280 [Actinomycetia bacterium]|nr:hypothetical protein [Actinomycetes bacterium]